MLNSLEKDYWDNSEVQVTDVDIVVMFITYNRLTGTSGITSHHLP